MSYKIGTVTYGTTGLKTINLGATSTPFAADFVVQNEFGVAESFRHVSLGHADINGQRVTAYLKDSTTFTYDNLTKCISVYEFIGGVATEVMSAQFDSFISNGLRLNILTAHSGYLIYIRVDY